jgi:hypothetical protein
MNGADGPKLKCKKTSTGVVILILLGVLLVYRNVVAQRKLPVAEEEVSTTKQRVVKPQQNRQPRQPEQQDDNPIRLAQVKQQQQQQQQGQQPSQEQEQDEQHRNSNQQHRRIVRVELNPCYVRANDRIRNDTVSNKTDLLPLFASIVRAPLRTDQSHGQPGLLYWTAHFTLVHHIWQLSGREKRRIAKNRGRGHPIPRCVEYSYAVSIDDVLPR